MCDEEVNTSRRSWLIAVTTALGLTGIGAWATPFIRFLSPSARAKAGGAPIGVDISLIPEGTLKIVEWRGIPIYIIRRSKKDLIQLKSIEPELKDPESETDQQPDYARNQTRSIKPEILVVEGICTHLGCTPKMRTATEEGEFNSLFCPCHGSRFDFAGRVYRNVPAPDNLRIPNHHYADEDLLIIGNDKGTV